MKNNIKNLPRRNKSKFVWIVNLIFFVAVVFLGIEQAGRGAEIAKLEDDLELLSTQKSELSESIFKLNTEGKLDEDTTRLGFAKPSTIYYFNSIAGVAARLP